MKKHLKTLLTLLMALTMIMAFSFTSAAADSFAEDYTGKTVILSTNDVHGAVEGYQYIAGLKAKLEKAGATVILVDAGDYSQGTTYVSESKGADAIALMNKAGYDYATLGNHEFDYGPDALDKNVAAMEFKLLCGDILTGDPGSAEIKYQIADMFDKNGLKIGFIGLATPESQTKALPSNFTNAFFPDRAGIADIVNQAAAALKSEGASLIVVIGHLGVDAESEPYRSTDLYADVKDNVDLIIDGHSHSVMVNGEGGEPIMSTGTAFNNIGVTVIDNATGSIEDRFLYDLKDDDGNFFEDLASDAEVKAASDKIVADVDAAYAVKIAESKVDLVGAKSVDENGVYGNRDGETNNGDLITDAMLWYVMKDAVDLGVDSDHVVVVTNGGGIRAAIGKGDVTKNDIKTVLPFGNTIASVTVTGEELLEALEASTYSLPVGGFPQVAGIEYNIDPSAAFDEGDLYPASTYHRPNSIKRVAIKSINGKAFDPKAKYVVLTNNFCAEGGDTYYVFKNATDQFDTGISLDYAVMAFVQDHLDGVIGEEYAAPQGRITQKDAAAVKPDLEKDIAAAKSIQKGTYTSASFNALQDVLAYAETLAANPESTASDMIYAQSMISEAVAGLEEVKIKVGDVRKVNGNSYKVTSTKSRTVSFKKAKKAKSIVVPATVKLEDGKVYKVTAVEAGAFTSKSIKSVTIGKNVKKIKAKAFSKSKATTVTLKTKLLKKSTVKSSLKGSVVKTVKVRITKKASDKTNKTYIKKYKKIFTKGNAGRKITVK